MKRTKRVIYILVLILGFQMIRSNNFTTTAYATTPTIEKIDYQFAAVCKNQKYSLPKKVKAKMSDNTTKYVEVTWKKKNINTSKYSFNMYYGTVNGYSKKVKLGLYVGNKQDVTAYKQVQKITKEITTSEMTVFEKELAVYDYLKPYRFPNEIPFTYREAFDNAIVDKVTVLGESLEYAEAFTAFMRVLGNNCKYVFDKRNGHMWNIVELGGEYYHVDAALANREGYKYLNTRDSVMKEIVEWDYEKYPECNSVKYNYDYIKFNKENNLNYDSVTYCYGTISLPKGKTAPKGGLKVALTAYDEQEVDVDVENEKIYDTSVTIPEGKNSCDYEFQLGPSIEGFKVMYKLENHVGDYIEHGYFNSQGTVHKYGEPEIIKGMGSSKVDFNIQEGEIVIEGKISIPKSDAAPKEDYKVLIEISDEIETPEYSRYNYYQRVSVIIPAGKRVGTFRVQLPSSVNGYKVGYSSSFNNKYTMYGYYGENGMTEDEEPKLFSESAKVNLTLIKNE